MGKRDGSGFDVFLGGTHHSNWRKEFLELLNKSDLNIKCYDPVVETWTYENVVLENLVKQNTKYHIYVLTPNMVGIYGIAEMIDSAHDDDVETYFYIKDEEPNKDGQIAYWNPRMLNSLYSLSNMMIKHGAHKARSLEELVDKVIKHFAGNCEE